MISSLLPHIGVGHMDSVPYDTAWLARLSIKYPEFSKAMDWLRSHQLPDGSWGSPAVYYHDRFINTLNAIFALHDNGATEDRPRIKRALRYLWRNYPQIRSDPHDTVAYAVLMTHLLKEASARGLHVPQYLGHNPAEVSAKLQLLSGASQGWRHHTMSFSLEIWLDHISGELDFLEDNGSAGISPGATAALLTGFDNPLSYRYIKGVVKKQGDGGLPNCDPIDIFEISWTLNYFRLAGVDPSIPSIQERLDILEKAWDPKQGSTYSTYFSVHDLDITSIVYTVLTWGGRKVDTAVFGYFELPESFRTYAHEVHPSLSVHLDLLIALQAAGADHNHPWVVKALGQIRRWKEQGAVWFDKWHISPYYISLCFEEALIDLDTSAVEERIRWVIASQHEDGGWGYFHKSTAEESAYALMTLLRWAQRHDGVATEIIDRGAAYLAKAAADEDYPALWIGKCLYMPRLIVQSVIASALHLYESENRSIRTNQRKSAIQHT